MKHLQTIKHYKTLLLCEQFLLTGSQALFCYGLVEEEKVGDLDILLINPTGEALNILSRLQESSPARTKPSDGGEVSYIFQHGDVKVDIFISKEKIQNVLQFEGIDLNPIKNIVNAKKKANRAKDWFQLRKLSRIFFKPEQFTDYLNNQG